MKAPIITIMLLILCGSSGIQSKEGEKTRAPQTKDEYYKFSNDKFNFSILLPKKWATDKMDLDYTLVMILSHKNSAEIKITASTADDTENEKWDTLSEWYAADIGSNLKIILEKDNTKQGTGYKSKIIVFQYNSQNKTILKRIMINRYSGKILVIECGAPVNSFYDYEKTFNAVMKSLEIKK